MLGSADSGRALGISLSALSYQRARDIDDIVARSLRVVHRPGGSEPDPEIDRVNELADTANVSNNTIARLKRGEEPKPRTVANIRAAVEAPGVIFIDGEYNGNGGPGIRLAI